MITVASKPNGGVEIQLQTRADVVELYSALIVAQVKGRGEELVKQLREILSKNP